MTGKFKEYELRGGKEETHKIPQTAAAKSDRVYHATDPDREGEAIAWHLAELLALNENEPIRVTFNEITKSGVQKGNGRSPFHRYESCGRSAGQKKFSTELSVISSVPSSGKKVRRGLSAGRVQSVVVRLIVDREEEIRKFVPEEYWTIDAKLSQKPTSKKFPAKLHTTLDGKKVAVSNEQQANEIKEARGKAQYKVLEGQKGTRTRQPPLPLLHRHCSRIPPENSE